MQNQLDKSIKWTTRRRRWWRQRYNNTATHLYALAIFGMIHFIGSMVDLFIEWPRLKFHPASFLICHHENVVT